MWVSKVWCQIGDEERKFLFSRGQGCKPLNSAETSWYYFCLRQSSGDSACLSGWYPIAINCQNGSDQSILGKTWKTTQSVELRAWPVTDSCESLFRWHCYLTGSTSSQWVLEDDQMLSRKWVGPSGLVHEVTEGFSPWGLIMNDLEWSFRADLLGQTRLFSDMLKNVWVSVVRKSYATSQAFDADLTGSLDYWNLNKPKGRTQA